MSDEQHQPEPTPEIAAPVPLSAKEIEYGLQPLPPGTLEANERRLTEAIRAAKFKNTACKSLLDRALQSKLAHTRSAACHRALPCRLDLAYLKALWSAQGGHCFFTGETLELAECPPFAFSLTRLERQAGFVR